MDSERRKLTAGRRNVAVLSATAFLIVASRYLWYGLLALHLRNLGASDQQVALVFTGSFLLLGPTQIIGGEMSDRWGRHHAISIPSVIMVPILLFGALARTWTDLAITVWLIGLFGGIQQPGFSALLAESASDADRGQLFGMFYAAVNAALILGPAAGAALEPLIGVRGLIWINVLVAGIAALVRLLMLREGPFTGERSARLPVNLGVLLRMPVIWKLTAANGLFVLLLTLTRDGPFIALHAADAMRMDEPSVNLLLAVGGVGATIASLLGGRLTDRVGGRALSGLSLSIHAALLLIWGMLEHASVGSYSLFGLSWVAVQVGIVGFSSWSSAYIPTGIRGRALGLVGAIGSVISAAGPPLGAALRDAFISQIGSDGGAGARLASAAPFSVALVMALVLGILVTRMPAQEGVTVAASSNASSASRGQR